MRVLTTVSVIQAVQQSEFLQIDGHENQTENSDIPVFSSMYEHHSNLSPSTSHRKCYTVYDRSRAVPRDMIAVNGWYASSR
jgi:hypothetical protein